MLSAIVYNSVTGSCKRYAELLGDALHLPAYSVKDFPVPEGRDIVYISWVLADGLTGYKKVAKRCRVAAAVRVGMGPVLPGLADATRKKSGIPADAPVFCLQGRFDLGGLPLPLRLIMTVKLKEIAARLQEKAAAGPLNEQEKATLQMATTGKGDPADWGGIEQVADWCRKNP